jgi:hypothetical protein
MAKESGLRHEVLGLLSPLHAVAIESPIEPGTPDVNCTAGWIELKHLNVWPVNNSTVVVPRHFKPEQRMWLRNRCAKGGSAWLLLRVGRSWCLVWGRCASEYLGVTWTRLDLVRPPGLCTIHWPSAPSSTELIKALTMRNWLHQCR